MCTTKPSSIKLHRQNGSGLLYYITVETKKKEDVTSIEISTKNTRNYVTIIFDTNMKKMPCKEKVLKWLELLIIEFGNTNSFFLSSNFHYKL